jgi:hypothetical protein
VKQVAVQFYPVRTGLICLYDVIGAPAADLEKYVFHFLFILSARLFSPFYHTDFFKTTKTVRLQTASALLGVKSRPSMRNCLFSRPVKLCYNINAVSLRQKGAPESPVRRLTIHDRLCDRNFIDLGFAQNLA